MEKKDLKILAFNLPQFHEIPENNKWWGEGFTEWVNVKKAKPLFNNHNQPRIPLNNNYYNLNTDEAVLWQMELASKFGIYGFVYYHYWFDGKLLLEKPVERLLKIKNKPINYCLCWANEPWTRAWDGGEKEVIMPQRYGLEPEWEKHYDYLLPFFKDEKYIKIDNKPMLVLYRANNVENCEQMIEFWNEKCKQDGFDGIYLIEEFNSFQTEKVCNSTQAMLEFEPMFSTTNKRTFFMKVKNRIKKLFVRKKTKNKIKTISYDDVWKSILKRDKKIKPFKVYLGAFVDWDNSPRRPNNGIVMTGSSPKKFENYLRKQVNNCVKYDSDFLFVNAWNEWAEGAYLEPDEKNQYQYLESIKKIMEEE